MWLCVRDFVSFFFFKQKTAYEIPKRDWSSDVCSSDLEGSAGLVLAAVASADGAGFIVEDVHVRAQKVADLTGFADEFGAIFQEWENGGFDRGDARMELQHDARLKLAFLVRGLLLVVGVADEGEDHAVHAGAGLDHVRDVTGFGLLIEILHGFAAELLVLLEVEIPARGDPLQFLGAEWKFKEDVNGGFGVVGQFIFFLPIFFEGVAGQADALIPAQSLLDPVFMPDFPAPVRRGSREIGIIRDAGDGPGGLLDDFVGLDEEFQFHLLELARAECEVAWIDLVAEGLADLADAERDLLTRNIKHVLELHEDGLGSFRAQVGHILRALDWPDVGLEHEVELARLGQEAAVLRVEACAVFDFFRGREFLRLGLFDSSLLVKAAGDFAAGLGRFAFRDEDGIGLSVKLAGRGGFGAGKLPDHSALRLDLIGAKAFVGQKAVHHQVGKGARVAAGFPDFRMHDNAGFQAGDVVARLRQAAPPIIFDVTLELGAERAVVPEAIDAAVNFGGLKDEPAPFAEGNNLFHAVSAFARVHREWAIFCNPKPMSRKRLG